MRLSLRQEEEREIEKSLEEEDFTPWQEQFLRLLWEEGEAQEKRQNEKVGRI